MSSNIDYAKTNFDYQVLTKIVGTPTYEDIKKIKDELKANAASVPSDLGGGAHGHLGLVLDATEYVAVTTTPYFRLTHP